MNLDTKLLVFSRSTYDFLTWMSDIGGATKALLLLSEVLVSPFTVFNLKSFLLTYLFRMASRSDDDQSEENKSSESKVS